ncbi:MAG TPA: glutamine--fructose-6-phosphate transaminase (isomerizing) [Armatimonadota bacterium]
MCGITGYVGTRASLPVVLEQLKRLEYRGYDSSGVALLLGDQLEVVRSVGKLASLESRVAGMESKAQVGIGHTRWATHGAPSDENAHPHIDCKGTFAVAHNGIIENYQELREWLMERGHHFTSETDTEVLPHLFEELYEGSVEQTLQKAFQRVEGSYACAIVTTHAPDTIFVARRQSPLVIGLAQGEKFVASDIPAVMGHTRDVLILEDGDIARVTKDAIHLFDENLHPLSRTPFTVTWDSHAAEKSGYEHFMLKEIHEQPAVLRDTLRGKLTDDGRVHIKELEPLADELRHADRINIVACGTAYHAGCVGKSFIEQLTGLPVEVDLASEYRYRHPIITDRTIVVVISQSGETADTLAALRESRARGAKVIGVINVVGSSIARESDAVVYTWAGPEICVASTKAYVTQLLALYLLGLHIARVRGVADAESLAVVERLRTIPDLLERVLEHADQVRELARGLAGKQDFFFLGRGADFAVALEGALKLKEISYLHAEAYAAGEMKHGPLALISPDVPIICLVTQERLREKMISNIKEMKARGARCVGITKEGDRQTPGVVDESFAIPWIEDMLTPILTVVPLQLLAYFIAKELGRDIDQPRNLAKSVTVE